MGAPGRARPLTRWERALGLALGDDDVPALPRDTAGRSPREALREPVARALGRPPCLVSFSGGRDSSAVLAVAVAEARRAGLPLPIPCTLRFAGAPDTEESEWQERVVAHLGLTDWEHVDLTDELDFVGATARRGLLEHGQLWPPNIHFHAPVLERARGGTVVTGFDGDGLFAAWRWEHVQAVLHRRKAPAPRDVLRVGLALAPRAVRRAVIAREECLPPWLTPGARREVARQAARDVADQPRRWDRHIRGFARSRFFRLPVHSLDLLAADHDVRVVHPLGDPGFLAALARHGGSAGYGGRSEAMRALFGDLLPDEVLTRRGKAEFGRAFWGPDSRAFAASWDGTGVDGQMVDGDILRREWAEPNPYISAATLLQGVWLASTRTGRSAPALRAEGPHGPGVGPG